MRTSLVSSVFFSVFSAMLFFKKISILCAALQSKKLLLRGGAQGGPPIGPGDVVPSGPSIGPSTNVGEHINQSPTGRGTPGTVPAIIVNQSPTGRGTPVAVPAEITRLL